MDTRGRKRRKEMRGKSSRHSPGAQAAQDSETAAHVRAASIPQYIPAVEMASLDLAVDSGACAAASRSEPRTFSSCSRLPTGRSPSPARVCRQREHSEMQVLNERLSSHAEHVKQLQAENARLRLQVEAMDDVIQRESRNMKLLHGSEIRSLQELIDSCNQEKSTLSSLHEKERLERERLGAELWDKEAEINSLRESVEALKAGTEDYHKLRIEFEAAEAALSESRQDAERMNAELLKEKICNRRLEQEASANKERYLKEVEEAGARFSEHMQQADQKLEEGYEAMVSSALTSLRQQHVRDLEGLRAELTTTYQSKLAEWKSACEIAQADLLAARREVKFTRQEQDKVRDVVTQLKADKASLQVQVTETQTRLEEVRDRAERERCQAQREVALLTQELAEQKEELEELGGVNSRLQAEINAYRLIVEDLEGQSVKTKTYSEEIQAKEEDCQEVQKLKGKSRKKKRTKQPETARTVNTKTDRKAFDIFEQKNYFRTNDFSQGIEIMDVDVSGRFISLVNTTDHPTDLCLWTVQQTDGQTTVKYELGVSTQLPKGKRLTVWSCNARPELLGGGEPQTQNNNSSIPGNNDNRDSGADDKQNENDDNNDDDNVDVDRRSESDDELSRNAEVRMVGGKSWLKLDRRLTVRVEDGDGQLQAKCDINSITDSGEPVRNSNSDTTAASTTTTNGSCRGKRPRLGGFFFPSSNNNSDKQGANGGAGVSFSETRFNKLRPYVTGADKGVVLGGVATTRVTYQDKDKCAVM